MRAPIRSLSVVALLAELTISAICGGLVQAADVSSSPAGYVGATGWNGQPPMLLADNFDSYGASRKFMGSTRYSSSGPSSNDYSNTADTPAPPFNQNQNNGMSGNGNQGNPTDGNGNPNGMQGQNRDSNIQSIYPSAAANPGQPKQNSTTNSNPNQRSAKNGGETADGQSTSPGGLKALQQRLAIVRKSSSGQGTVEPAPTGLFGGQTNSSRPSSNEAPSVEMGAPATPSYRVALTPSTNSTSIANSPARTKANATSEASEAQSNSTPAPVVGRPLVSSRRAPPSNTAADSGAASTEQRDQSTTTKLTPGPQSPTAHIVTATPAIDSRPPVPPSGQFTPMADIESRSSNSARKSTASADTGMLSRQSPLIGVETSGPRSIMVGKDAAYGVTITNAGEAAAQDVVVSVKIPEWTEVVGTKTTSGVAETLPEQRGEPLVWRLNRMEAHSKEQLVVRLVPRESRPFELAVQWACSPVSSQAMVEVKEPKLAMSLDGPSEVTYGQTKVYRLSISNPGTGDAEGVVLFLAPVDGGPGAPTRHDVGLVKAGESKPIEVELTPRQAGSLAIKALATGEGNLRAEVAEEILVRRAALKTAVMAPELKFAGTPTTYNILISNPGNATAENVSIAALLPPGAKFISAQGGQLSDKDNKVVWNVSSLRPGAEQELELRCTLNSPGTNRLQLLATAANDLSDSAAVTTSVEALADLKLEVTDPPGPLAVGEEMIYEVHIRNRGTKAAESVDVAGFFSNGIEPVSAQGAQSELGSGQVVFRPIPSIAPGTEVVLKIKARADLAGNHVFRAEVNCNSVGAKLASEETTMFYGDNRIANRPSSRSNSGGATVPTTQNSAPLVR